MNEYLLIPPRDGQSWRDRHNAAVKRPRASERSILALCEALETICAQCADETADYLLRDDVLLPIFQAASSFLDWDLGRLDGGMISAWLYDRAASVGIDLDIGEVTDGGSDPDDRYDIVRMYYDDRPSVIVRRNLTLDEAQAHCRRDDTRGGSVDDGTAWFDRYQDAAR